jgi:hypothetical protein
MIRLRDPPHNFLWRNYTCNAITGVSLLAGATHSSHVAFVRWLETTNGNSDTSDVAAMVKFIEANPSHPVVVGGKNGWATVEVVRPRGGTPYLRSHKDGTETDNLMRLLRF